MRYFRVRKSKDFVAINKLNEKYVYDDDANDYYDDDYNDDSDDDDDYGDDGDMMMITVCLRW